MYIDDHSYIANISSCSEQEIQTIKFALNTKDKADFLRQMVSAETSYWKKA
jgi:hypothetical protein